VLIASDIFEFSWRYQLPALVTLPPAAGFAISVLLTGWRGRRAAAKPTAAAAGVPGGNGQQAARPDLPRRPREPSEWHPTAAN
jgi:hypothetical protein